MRILSLILLALTISCGKSDNTNNNASRVQNSATAQRNRITLGNRLMSQFPNEKFLYICEESSEAKSNRSLQNNLILITSDISSGFFRNKRLTIKRRTFRKNNLGNVINYQEKEGNIGFWRGMGDRNFDLFYRNGRVAGVRYDNLDDNIIEMPFGSSSKRQNYSRYCEDRLY